MNCSNIFLIVKQYNKVYGDRISIYGLSKFLSEEIGKFADFDDEKRSVILFL